MFAISRRKANILYKKLHNVSPYCLPICNELSLVRSSSTNVENKMPSSQYLKANFKKRLEAAKESALAGNFTLINFIILFFHDRKNNASKSGNEESKVKLIYDYVN